MPSSTDSVENISVNSYAMQYLASSWAELSFSEHITAVVVLLLFPLDYKTTHCVKYQLHVHIKHDLLSHL